MIDQLSLEQLTLTVTEEIRVRASLETTFATLLEEMGPHNETPSGETLAMKIEPWPGGRWFRDLGGDNGHFWGVVQAIKRRWLKEQGGGAAPSGGFEVDLSQPAPKAVAVAGGPPAPAPRVTLELSGPLFFSAPVMSNMQYRLTAVDGGTLISFRHSALGFVPDEVRKDLGTGWSQLHARVRRVAEQKK